MKPIARALRSLLPSAFRRFFYRVTQFLVADLVPPFPSVERTLLLLKTSGFNPRFCVDIGAYTGEWAIMFRSIFPESVVLMLEAQDSKAPQLESLAKQTPEKLSFQLALLGPEDGLEVEFSEMETGSSVFAESSAVSRQTKLRTTSRLDSVLGNGKPTAEFIKLDVQGYELEVLKGASASLAKAEAVLMESSLVPINKGCPTISEVIRFMDERSFALFDFCSQIRREDGVLWQTDLLFVRRDSKLLPMPSLH